MFDVGSVPKAITATPWDHESNTSTVVKAITAAPFDYKLYVGLGPLAFPIDRWVFESLTLNLVRPSYESAISAPQPPVGSPRNRRSGAGTAMQAFPVAKPDFESVVAYTWQLMGPSYESAVRALKAGSAGPRDHEPDAGTVPKAVAAAPSNDIFNPGKVRKAIMATPWNHEADTGTPWDREPVVADTLNLTWPIYDSVISALKARAAADGRHALDVNKPFEEIDADLNGGLAAVWRGATASLLDWLDQPKVKAIGSLSAVMMLSGWWVNLVAYHPDLAELIEVPLSILVALLMQLVFMTWPRKPK